MTVVTPPFVTGGIVVQKGVATVVVTVIQPTHGGGSLIPPGDPGGPEAPGCPAPPG